MLDVVWGWCFNIQNNNYLKKVFLRILLLALENFGCSEDEVKQRVKEAMDFVELDYEEYKDKSPFFIEWRADETCGNSWNNSN